MRPLFLFAIYGVAFAGVTLFRATAGANNPAHDLAQKFAAGDQETAAAQPLPSMPQPNIPQAKPQMTAPKPAALAPKPKAKAQQAQAQTQAQPQAPAAPSVTAPPAAAPKAPPAPTAKPRPPAPGPDYERDMLDAARAEAAARETLQTQQAESKPPAAAPAVTPAAAAAAQPPPSSPPPSAQATTPQAPVPAQAAAPTPAPAAAPQIRIEAKVNVPAPAIVARPDGAPLATILAVLTHHAQNSARAITPPDPIICLADICYISAGPNADAKLISRADALSTKNTVTSGAGACKGVSRCAFRGVSMKRGDEVQIIDLGLVGHDKREPADVTPDTTCHVDDGDLVCDQPVAAPDYRIWVVPETVAAAAGPGAIEHALADDLPEEDIARTEDK